MFPSARRDITKMQVLIVVCILLNLQSSVHGGCEQNASLLMKTFYGTLYFSRAVVHISKDYYTSDMEAQRVCRSVCGDLLEVNNLDEYKVVKRFIEDSRFLDGLLISGTDKYQEGFWVHHTNQKPMTYVLWHEGEPNNFKEMEDCLSILKGYDLMYDVSCDLYHYKLKYACKVPRSFHRFRT